jgi:hypothetical protein
VGHIGDYQSAIQLVVGANLAFFTFPELREPALPRLRSESERWASLVRAAAQDEMLYDVVLEGVAAVHAIKASLDRRLAIIRVLCLVLAILYSVLLLWTCYAASRETDGSLLEIASVFGILPAVALMLANRAVSRGLAKARHRRHRLERRIR